MAKGFAKGLVTGVAGTVAALAGAVYAFKKKVIDQKSKKQLSSKKTVKKQLAVAYHVKKQKKLGFISQLLFLFF